MARSSSATVVDSKSTAAASKPAARKTTTVSKPLKAPRTTKGVKNAPTTAAGRRDLPTEELNAARPDRKQLKMKKPPKPPEPLKRPRNPNRKPPGRKRKDGTPAQWKEDPTVEPNLTISKERYLAVPKGQEFIQLKKATRDAKKAIAMFVDNNAGRLQEWLDAVAWGVVDADGKYVVPPDPLRAFAMFQSVIEYHIPKLARQELVGAGGGAIQIDNLDLKSLSEEELRQVEALLLKAATNNIIEQS